MKLRIFTHCAYSPTTVTAARGTGSDAAASRQRPFNTAADYVTIIKMALARLPSNLGDRVARIVLIRADGAGGAQSRFADHDGPCLAAFVTNTARGQLAALNVRHRSPGPDREDRIRTTKRTGLQSLPLHG
ncbi:hypothetical protein OG921_04590 [Aldersonia sp. NBC_00410]|uniref:hypothetical protein n=1 Tax=Aldersonia sp. NBC_00410 TaxID=2975954 RepID=UPI0022583CA2|nr:hypothetical protein [Aldersonia sp. NBC_00410]MCX5042451.1 hypothetical protein [Aldersonia sp. NBC_00410]